MRNTPKRLLAAVALSAAGAAVAAFVNVSAATAAPAEGTVRGAHATGAIKDNYIVVFKSGSSESRTVDTAAATLSHRYGGALTRAYHSTVHGFAARLTETAAKHLAANPAVDYVEQDRTVHLTGTQTPTPSWGLDRIDQTTLPLNSTYTYPTTANTVTAYIIDTGVRTTTTDFAGRARNGYDFIDNDTVAGDCAGHGTHVAGTVGGTTYGVAKNVNLVAVRVLDCSGSGSYSQIIAGVDWVTRNAVKPAVANMSLGGAAGSTLDNAVQASIASGVTYAVAAGNDNTDACQQSPARLPDAITVAATDNTDKRSSFSNYGNCVDIFAPGTAITSDYNSGDTATTTMSGTSMATPHVTGAAALYLSANPTATPAQVRDALVTNAVTGTITNTGTGSPNKLLNVTNLATTAPVTPPSPTPTTSPSTSPSPTPTTAPSTTTCAPITNSYQQAIADLSTVTSKITVANCPGNASATTKVTVDIKHTYRGDLAISLIAPDGTVYKLKSANAYDDAADVNTTYTVNASSELRNGLWKLRVKDSYAGDTGTLVSWTLAV
jgi:subtilisin family serine protease